MKHFDKRFCNFQSETAKHPCKRKVTWYFIPFQVDEYNCRDFEFIFMINDDGEIEDYDDEELTTNYDIAYNNLIKTPIKLCGQHKNLIKEDPMWNNVGYWKKL